MHIIINVLGAISRKLYLVYGLKFGLLSIRNPRKHPIRRLNANARPSLVRLGRTFLTASEGTNPPGHSADNGM